MTTQASLSLTHSPEVSSKNSFLQRTLHLGFFFVFPLHPLTLTHKTCNNAWGIIPDAESPQAICSFCGCVTGKR